MSRSWAAVSGWPSEYLEQVRRVGERGGSEPRAELREVGVAGYGERLSTAIVRWGVAVLDVVSDRAGPTLHARWPTRPSGNRTQ